MRRLKYRIWHTWMDQMSYSDDLYMFEELGVHNNSEDDEIMQYTGIEDKNGIEIYEGDILKRGDFPDDESHYFVRFGRFTDSPDDYYKTDYVGWHVDEVGKKGEYNDSLLYITEILDGEVIGNLYEHPSYWR